MILACSALNDLMLLLNVEKTLVLYSIVSDIPKNELMTIPEIARVTIVLIKNIENNFLLIVKDNKFISPHY